MQEQKKEEPENRQELPSLQVRGQSQMNSGANSGQRTLSPANPIGINSGQILELDQQSEQQQRSFQLNDDLVSPLSPNSKKKTLNQHQMIADISYKNARGEINQGNASSMFSDTQRQMAGVDTGASLESQSQRNNDPTISADQDINILRAGVHIPQLVGNNRTGGMKEESFEIGSPVKSSNAAYFSQLADNSISGHDRGSASVQGKQQLINSGAKVMIDGSALLSGSQLGALPNTTPPIHQSNFTDASFSKIRGDSMSSAGQPLSQKSAQGERMKATQMHMKNNLSQNNGQQDSISQKANRTGSGSQQSTMLPRTTELRNVTVNSAQNHQPVRMKNVTSAGSGMRRSGSGTRGHSNAPIGPSAQALTNQQMNQSQYGQSNSITPQKRPSMNQQNNNSGSQISYKKVVQAQTQPSPNGSAGQSVNASQQQPMSMRNQQVTGLALQNQSLYGDSRNQPNQTTYLPPATNQNQMNNQGQSQNQQFQKQKPQNSISPNKYPDQSRNGLRPPQNPAMNRQAQMQHQANSFRGQMNMPKGMQHPVMPGQNMNMRSGFPGSNPNNIGGSLLTGSQLSGQQQMNPLFKMSGGPTNQGNPNNLHPHNVAHNPHGTMQGHSPGMGNNPNTQANITGLSHPSTATHQNATHEHLNSTVGSHTKPNENKDGPGHGSATAPTVQATNNQGVTWTGHNNDGTVKTFQMFERENFKFKDSIMIHVIDDSKNEKRDFTFSRSLLVKYMKYFDRCLKKISDNDEIDISIHCDAVIFEWLLNYIFAMEEYEKKQSEQDKFNRAVGSSVNNNWSLKVQKIGEDGEKEKNNFANSAIMQYGGPKLDIKNAVTILIPAEFLKIDRLVRECLDFIGEHIEEISRVQVDMSCINTNIIREMAKKVSLDRLDVLKERKDKIVSRLFMKKLELLLEKDKNHLYKCAYCNKLFTKKQRKVLSCRKGTSFVDSNGQMRAKHVVDKAWDLKKFVTYVRETYRISWKEIYWKVWSYLHLIKCDRCHEYYPIAEMGYCRYHSVAPKVKMNLHGPFGSTYEYSCCNNQVDVYQVLNGTKGDSGCQTQLHETRHIYNVPKNKEKKIIDRIIAHQLIILENPTQAFIESIKLEEKGKSGPVPGTGFAVTAREANPGHTPLIVRPSSLNYKISLIEAVRNFITKERCGPDQQIEVELEEPTSKKMVHFEILDDALFDLKFVPKPLYLKEKGFQQLGKNKRDSSHRIENQWEREEEQIRKKLEKNSINQMKNKIAQQNRANMEQSNQTQSDANPDQQAQGGGQDKSNQANQQNMQNANNQNQNNQGTAQVQLSQTQIEEAKLMTQGKLKMYRRDRLYASDKDRLENLQNCLKNVRVMDETAYFNSQTADMSPAKGTTRLREGMPPKSTNVVGRGGGGGGGPGGGGAGGTAGGGGAGGTSFTSSGAKQGPDKGGQGANKGQSEYSSQARQHGSASNNKYAMGPPAATFHNATIAADPAKVLTNIQSITQKRQKSSNVGASAQSGQLTPYGTNTSQPRREESPNVASPHQKGRQPSIDQKSASCSPTRESPHRIARLRQHSKSREKQLQPYGQSLGNSQVNSQPTQNNFQSNMTTDSQEMNSLLKSPLKNNMRQLPNIPSGSGKKGAVVVDHSAATSTVVNPTSFVVQF